MSKDKFFLWTPEWNDAIEREDYTFQFVVSGDGSEDILESLVDNQLWVALKKQDKIYLYSSFFVTSIEKVEDNDSANYYLLCGDIEHSEYFQRIDNLDENLRIDQLSWVNGNYVVWPSIIDDFRSTQIDLISKKAIKITNLLPPSGGPLGFSFDSLPDSAKNNFEVLYEIIKRKYPKNEVPCHISTPESWSSYDSFVYGCLTSISGKNRQDIESIIRSKKERHSFNRFVDTFFTSITPDNIRTRKFLSPKINPEVFYDENGMLKTDVAEEEHQKILRDFSMYLIRNGMIPKESKSMDLVLEDKNSVTIFEIKSANSRNFRKQSFSAIIQLGEYSYAMKKRGNKVGNRCLLINKINDEKEINYVKNICLDFNVMLLTYDAEKSWPERIHRLTDLF